MNVDESMLDVYIYETQQLLESLENTLFAGENDKKLNTEQINEVFRIMHTIKGASAMMEFEHMAKLAHSLEDMFALIRENDAGSYDWPAIFDNVFSAISFFNGELAKLLDKQTMDGDSSDLIAKLKLLVARMKGESAAPAATAKKEPEAVTAETPVFDHKGDEAYYKVKLFFEENSQMENIRAFGVVQAVRKISVRFAHIPEDLNGDAATEEIRNNGFLVFLQSGENPDRIKALLETTLFLKSCSVLPIDGDDEEVPAAIRQGRDTAGAEAAHETLQAKADDHQANGEGGVSLESVAKQNFISVNVNKLDNLLNIVGEIVTAQSMVINNADFGDRQHDSFDSAAQQLHSLINELQDIVMSIRMIPVSTLFQKMRRLVRDMSKKFGKQIELEIIGEETEVDKNVIDYLSDPLLHIIRNSVDHGIEDAATRTSNGKPAYGKITLEARMTGSDVIVTITDDGGGLSRDNILKKASEKGLLTKPESEMSDKEVYGLIFLPGFSTKDQVTEFSGRGVGMDVVRKNIGVIGGSVTVDSTPGMGTTHTIRIPLTLTIVDGMKFNVGKMNFIVPTVSVRSAVKPDVKDIFTDPEGNEMIMLLGNVYSLIRLSRFFNIEDAVTDLADGMVMHIASEEREFCIFFDHLDGEYQVVVKKLPNYLKHCSSSLDGVSGCAILGDGSINLIIDVNSVQ
ncbi:two-component system, chemotaxis family, sensor kinase CheA [Sporobacter termitidis DSM 10068]|uniref:Chemotaxis protein CheA n=1 Tax=Sporobacter termitidis DSM 10068 TaxID=1123282 RepID=A0A1M5W947_9FIRM|nr:chemotaxis protein CheA [Sporobacter termitidis]SHH84000.1 two-component system, chemotaxis family, sensor kinase CheA [Sporobacter termitidis DSM 10068]